MSAGDGRTLLVVGAAECSLGEAVSEEAAVQGFKVVTAGVRGEDHVLDVTQPMRDVLWNIRPTDIVCTVGINTSTSIQSLLLRSDLHRSFEVNAIGPLMLLKEFISLSDWERGHIDGNPAFRTLPARHYAAISSNSAGIPRTGGVAYCSSKAALTMGIRVAARELAKAEHPVVPYVYEFGLLADTPMTRKTRKTLGAVPLTRMPDPRLVDGVPAAEMAAMVVANLSAGLWLSGTVHRLDGGEI